MQDPPVAEVTHQVGPADERGDGETVGQRLAQHSEIWDYALTFLDSAGGHAESGDDLVEDQDRSRACACFANGLQIARKRLDARRVEHDGLHDDGGHIAAGQTLLQS